MTDIDPLIGIVVGTVAGLAILWKAGQLRRRDKKAWRDRSADSAT